MIQRRNLPNLIAAAVIVAILTFFLTQTRIIQEAIAPPIYVLFFVIVNFLRSLPELLFWILFIVAVTHLFLKVILRNFNIWLDRRIESQLIREEEFPGTVEKYLNWIEQEDQGLFFKWRLRQRVMQLALVTIGRSENLPLPELERALEDNSFDLPPAVTRYMQEGISARELDRQPRQPLNFLRGSNRQSSDQANLMATLAYLEEVLEIQKLPPRSTMTLIEREDLRKQSFMIPQPKADVKMKGFDKRNLSAKSDLKRGIFEGKDVQGRML